MNRYILLFGSLFGVLTLAAQEALPGLFDVVVQNETNVNSEALEFSPTFYEDGILFISSREQVFKFLDRRMNNQTLGIFRSTRDGEGVLGVPTLFTTNINTKYHEGPLCFDAYGAEMYFTRNNYLNRRLRKSKDGWVNLRILKASRVGDGWDNVRDLPFNSDDFSSCHPSLSADGERLYFASDRPGGFGGLDIYYVEKSGDNYGEPVNLGPEVNTSRDEIFPFIHADGTLFFSSGGRPGLGGLDIYYTRMQADSQWNAALPLPEPFNTDKDDFGFILDLETKNGYFSSNRPGGKGEDDIYRFYVREGLNSLLDARDLAESLKPRELRVFVADKVTGNFLSGAFVSFMDLVSTDLSNVLTITDEQGNLIRIQSRDPQSDELTLTVDMAESEIKGFTNQEGAFVATIVPSTYVISINAEQYLPNQVVIDPDFTAGEILIQLESLGDLVPFSGVVMDPRYNTPIPGAKVTVRDKATGEVVTTVYTDRNGQFQQYLPRDRDYELTLEKDDFKATRDVSTRNLPEGAEIAMAFDITDPQGRNPLATGSVINMPNIYYNFNDASIRPDARPDLDALATILSQFPQIKIELASHTDARGSDSFNQRLSQRRADNTLRYLADKGVKRNRLTAKGYGESQLKNHCADGVDCAEEEHQVNRRTEFRILEGPSDVVFNFPEAATAQPVAGSTPVKVDDIAPAANINAEEGNFVVIAGTFKNKANADRRLAELRGWGFDSASLVSGSGNTSAVMAGTFSSREEAETLVKALRDQHKISSYIRRQ